MSILEHLDELRSRLLAALSAYAIAFLACWAFSEWLLAAALRPIRTHFFAGGEIVFTRLTEPFVIYMKVAALAAIFVASPYLLYQVWRFVGPGLHRHERRLALPFLLFGTMAFVAGGAFGYGVATPVAARWLLALGERYRAMITLESAFAFQARVILAMGAVFELPVLIFFLSRLGIVTPAWLMKHFRWAVIVIAVLAAVLTPTGDVVTMSVFAGPMIVLYLLGVAVAWLFGRPAAP